jgi:hypothetical protein
MGVESVDAGCAGWLGMKGSMDKRSEDDMLLPDSRRRCGGICLIKCLGEVGDGGRGVRREKSIAAIG